MKRKWKRTPQLVWAPIVGLIQINAPDLLLRMRTKCFTCQSLPESLVTKLRIPLQGCSVFQKEGEHEFNKKGDEK